MATLAGSASHATSGASRVISAPQKVALMRSSAMSLGAIPHRATSTMGGGASVGAKNVDAPQDSAEPRSATPSGVSAMKTAGAGAATGGAAAAVGATMRVAKSSARGVTQSVTQSADVTVTRVTPQGFSTSSPSGDAGSSGPLSARGMSRVRPSPRDLPSPSPAVSTSPNHTVSPAATSSPTHAAMSTNAITPSPAHTSTPESGKQSTSFPSSVPPLRFNPPVREEESS